MQVAKRAGLALAETKVLLGAPRPALRPLMALRDLAARKLPDIEALIERVTAMRG